MNPEARIDGNKLLATCNAMVSERVFEFVTSSIIYLAATIDDPVQRRQENEEVEIVRQKFVEVP